MFAKSIALFNTFVSSDDPEKANNVIYKSLTRTAEMKELQLQNKRVILGIILNVRLGS